MRTIAHVTLLCFATGCIGRTATTRPVAYAANAVIVAAGIAAVAYAASGGPTTRRDSLGSAAEHFDSDFTVTFALLGAGLAAIVVGGVGLAGTIRAQGREELALRSAPLAADAPPAPAAPVAEPAPDIARLAVQARLLAAGGHCDAALALDRRIRDADPAWHRAVLATDPGLRACRGVL
jgi:hypothetical protein